MKSLFMKIYTGNYKLYLIPVAILYLVFLFLIFVSPGITKGVDLEGGTLIVLRGEKEINAPQLEALLKQNFNFKELKVSAVSGPTGYGVTIQYAENTDLTNAEKAIADARALKKADPEGAKAKASEVIGMLSKFSSVNATSNDIEDIFSAAEDSIIKANQHFENKLQDIITKEFSLSNAKMQVKDIRPVLGETFWQNAINVSAIAFFLVVVVVFIFFREFIPALAVLAAAIFDVLAALAGMELFKIPLSLSTIPALLMLIGYSVDTDIMLTSRMLKGKEKTPAERAGDSIATGLTMTGTTLAALVSMLIISYFSQIFVIFDIAAVLLFGLIADIPSTWFMNASVLLWYIEKKERKNKSI